MSYFAIALILGKLTFTFYLAAIYSDFAELFKDYL